MTEQRDRSSVNAEVHRLKNRVRQQRYRARKREKAKRDEEASLRAGLFILDVANVTNGLPPSKHDVGSLTTKSVGVKSVIRSADLGHGDIDNCCEGAKTGIRSAEFEHGNVDNCCKEAEYVQVKFIVRQQQQQQQCNVELFGTDVEGEADSPGNCHTFHSHKILQPLSQMDNGYDTNTLKKQYGYAVNPLDQREHTRSHNDVMARRLKNRERQRRYRARKRLEADTKKDYLINQSTPVPVELQPSGDTSKSTTRVHCQRDWKEDARRAHMSKEAEMTSSGPPFPALNFASEEQAHIYPSEIKVEPQFEGEFQSEHLVSLNNSEANGATLGRRDWKVAARNKVD